MISTSCRDRAAPPAEASGRWKPKIRGWRRLRPDEYSHHRRVAGIDNHWQASFDWQNGEIRIVNDDGEPLLLELPGESIDPLTLKLEMRRRLAEPEPDLRFLMVEEDEIDEQNFRVLPNEWLETSLGCLETVPVEKIRRNSKRYTRAWHAVELANIEVRMEHGKEGGDHLEMRSLNSPWMISTSCRDRAAPPAEASGRWKPKIRGWRRLRPPCPQALPTRQSPTATSKAYAKIHTHPDHCHDWPLRLLGQPGNRGEKLPALRRRLGARGRRSDVRADETKPGR
jgi:hypothetical protein